MEYISRNFCQARAKIREKGTKLEFRNSRFLRRIQENEDKKSPYGDSFSIEQICILSKTGEGLGLLRISRPPNKFAS